MSIFFKFGVEAGDPMKVNCDGMDMNLGDLKLAIKDIKGIKNVKDNAFFWVKSTMEIMIAVMVQMKES